MAGVELVRDRASKQSFDPGQRIGKHLHELCLEAGLIVRAIGDTIALSPPLVIGEAEVEEIVSGLSGALGRLAEELR